MNSRRHPILRELYFLLRLNRRSWMAPVRNAVPLGICVLNFMLPALGVAMESPAS